jgi:hypothetical protein
MRGAAHDHPQAHASQAVPGEAVTSQAHARSCAPNRRLAPVSRIRLLQLLRCQADLTSLGVFRDRACARWRALRRRSQKHRTSWTRTLTLAQRWFPPPHVLHSFPDARFAATYLRYALRYCVKTSLCSDSSAATRSADCLVGFALDLF